MDKESHNYYIDFLKFVFSLIIVSYHSWVFSGKYGNGIFNNGYLAVDFYFIITGYLLMNSINKINSNKESIGILTFKFLKGKLIKLIPSLIVTFVIGYVLIYGINLKPLLSNDVIGELFQLYVFGYKLTINTAWWYISAMLFILLLIFPIAFKNKKSFAYFTAPIIIFITISMVNYHSININDPLSITYLFPNGFYKGIIFICLGTISYEISAYLKKSEIKKIQKWLLTLLETFLYSVLIYNMNKTIMGNTLVAMIFTFTIALTFSNQCYTQKIFKSKKIKILNELGIIIFLNNCSIRSFLLKQNYNYSYRKMFVIYFLLVFIVSIISYFIIHIFTYDNMKKFKQYIHKGFTKK